MTLEVIRRALPGALLPLLLAADVTAQEAPLPPLPQVGDRFETEARFLNVPCSSWTVMAVDPAREVVADCEGWRAVHTSSPPRTLTLVLRPDGSRLYAYDPYSPVLDFPLRVGKSWQASYEGFNGELGIGWSSNIRCLVEAYEEGEHPEFRIRCDDSFSTLLIIGGTHTSVFWYSPELGRITRQQHLSEPKYSWRLRGW